MVKIDIAMDNSIILALMNGNTHFKKKKKREKNCTATKGKEKQSRKNYNQLKGP